MTSGRPPLQKSFPTFLDRETHVSQERSEAIVLRGVDFSETSRIVTFLAPTRGRFSCMAAGARRAKSPLGSVLDTFNRVEIVYYWKDTRDVQRLAEAQLLDGYPGLKSSVPKSLFAAFPLELVYHVVQQNEPSEQLYKVFVQGLKSMNVWQGDPRAHSAWQVMRILLVTGFTPNLVSAQSPLGFSFDYGVTNEPSAWDMTITPEVLADLRILAQESEHCPDLADPPAVFGLLREFVARQVGKEFCSLRVIDQVFKTTNQ